MPHKGRKKMAFGPATPRMAKAAMAPPKPVRRVRGAVAPSGPLRGVKGATKAVAAYWKANRQREIAAIREVIHGKEIGKFIDALQKARSGPAALPLMEKRLHRQTPTLRRAPAIGPGRQVGFEMPEGLPSKRPRTKPLRGGRQNPRAR